MPGMASSSVLQIKSTIKNFTAHGAYSAPSNKSGARPLELVNIWLNLVMAHEHDAAPGSRAHLGACGGERRSSALIFSDRQFAGKKPLKSERDMYRTILLGVAMLQATAVSAQEPATAVASFVDRAGQDSGTAELSAPASGGILIKVEVDGLPSSSWVAFHVHETGTVPTIRPNTSWPPTLNPISAEHGYQMAKGPHAGDMPNQYVPADGRLRAEVFNPAVTLDDTVNGVRGRALMIHAKPDDYRSQPSGGAETGSPARQSNETQATCARLSAIAPAKEIPCQPLDSSVCRSRLFAAGRLQLICSVEDAGHFLSDHLNRRIVNCGGAR